MDKVTMDFSKAKFGNTLESQRRTTGQFARIYVNNSSDNRSTLTITFYNKCMELMRWKTGDRLAVAYHKGFLVFKRADSGYKITQNSKASTSFNLKFSTDLDVLKNQKTRYIHQNESIAQGGGILAIKVDEECQL